MTEENLSNFNKEFFKKIKESNVEDHDSYIEKICSQHTITDNQEIRALIVFFYWNHYLNKLFPNIITKKLKENKDPRVCSIFKYCYKLQKETNGILDEKDYKDYVFCQIKFLKIYIEKTNNPVQVTPNILNIDKGWKKWKYFKYILSKSKHSDKDLPFVNNDILKNYLKKDREFLETKMVISIDNIKKNNENIFLWNKVGKLSVYFIAFNHQHLSKSYKDYSIYRFDDNGKKLFKVIFPELR